MTCAHIPSASSPIPKARFRRKRKAVAVASLCLLLSACGGSGDSAAGGGSSGGGGAATGMSARFNAMHDRIRTMPETMTLPAPASYTYDGIAKLTIDRHSGGPAGLRNAALGESFTLLSEIEMQATFRGGPLAQSTLEGRATAFEVAGQPGLTADGVLTINPLELSRGLANRIAFGGDWEAQVDIYPTTASGNVDRVVAGGDISGSLRGAQAQALQGGLRGTADVGGDLGRNLTGQIRAER